MVSYCNFTCRCFAVTRCSPSEQKPTKNFGEKGAWVYPGTAQIFWVSPIISGTCKVYKLHIWQEHSQGPSKQKSIKIFWEKGVWAYPGTAQIFLVPLLSQEQVKLRTSNFVCIFIASIGRKSPLKNFVKSSHGHSQGFPKISRALIYTAHRAPLQQFSFLALK